MLKHGTNPEEIPCGCCWSQIRALDKMTLERVSAERMECLRRIDERAERERLEGEKKQVIIFALYRVERMEFCPLRAPNQVLNKSVSNVFRFIIMKRAPDVQFAI